MVKGGAYSLQPGHTGQSAAPVDCPEADFLGRESELLAARKGSGRAKIGHGPATRADSLGCTSGLPSWSQLKGVTLREGWIIDY